MPYPEFGYHLRGHKTSPFRMCPVLLTIVLAIQLSTVCSTSVLEAIFTNKWTKLHAFDSTLPQVPEGQCAYVNTTFNLRIETGNDSQVFRVPHSRITVDGAPCGSMPSNATVTDLYLDDYMLLAPSDVLLNATVAQKKGLAAMRRDLFDQGDRHGLAMTAFQAFTDLGLEMWVGYEATSDRISSGKTILSRTSFTIFLQTQGKLDIGSFLGLPAGANSLIYDGSEDVMMTFDEPFSNTETPDRVCPSSRQIFAAAPSKPPPSCFPGDAKVLMQDETTKRMRDIVVGDALRCPDEYSSEVFLFTHRDSSTKLHLFVELTTSDNSTLTASPGHYLYAPDKLIPAASLSTGSWLRKADGSVSQVVRKGFVRKHGLYNPQTISGNLIVDGFVVSAYTTAIRPSIAHTLLGVFRAMYKLAGQGSMMHKWFDGLFPHGVVPFTLG